LPSWIDRKEPATIAIGLAFPSSINDSCPF
jgi:hypothetical protein